MESSWNKYTTVIQVASSPNVPGLVLIAPYCIKDGVSQRYSTICSPCAVILLGIDTHTVEKGIRILYRHSQVVFQIRVVRVHFICQRHEYWHSILIPFSITHTHR